MQNDNRKSRTVAPLLGYSPPATPAHDGPTIWEHLNGGVPKPPPAPILQGPASFGGPLHRDFGPPGEPRPSLAFWQSLQGNTPATRQPPLRATAQSLARAGRGKDNAVAHVTAGELVLPARLQTPEVMAAIARAALGGMQVGNAHNRLNPATGAPEFDDDFSPPTNDGVDPGFDRPDDNDGKGIDPGFELPSGPDTDPGFDGPRHFDPGTSGPWDGTDSGGAPQPDKGFAAPIEEIIGGSGDTSADGGAGPGPNGDSSPGSPPTVSPNPMEEITITGSRIAPESEINGLARAITGEAAGQRNIPGAMEAVGSVIRNRVGKSRFSGGAHTLTDVLHSGQINAVDGPIWKQTADPTKMTGPNAAAYSKALDVADGLLKGSIPDPTGGALYYHSGPPPEKFFKKSIANGSITRTAKIGPFTFYKDK